MIMLIDTNSTVSTQDVFQTKLQVRIKKLISYKSEYIKLKSQTLCMYYYTATER